MSRWFGSDEVRLTEAQVAAIAAAFEKHYTGPCPQFGSVLVHFPDGVRPCPTAQELDEGEEFDGTRWAADIPDDESSNG